MEANRENTNSRPKQARREKDKEEHWRFIVPVFLMNVMLSSTRMMFPVLYSEFIQYFGTEVAAAGWIGSVQVGAAHFFGIVFSGAVKIYGCRVVAFAGSLVIAVGLGASFLAPNLPLLCVSYGLVSGIGLSMCALSCGTLVQQRFHKNRALATSVSMTALGVGSVIGPMWTSVLLRSYGWRGSLLIQAGVALNGCVLAMFMWTPKLFSFKDGDTKGRKGCLRAYLRDLSDFSALRDLAFIILCLSQALSKFTMVGSTRHLANKALIEGFSKTEAAFLVSIVSGGLLIIRIPAGKLADSKRVNRVVLVGVVLIISGLLLASFCLPDKYAAYAILAAALGATIGCTNMVEAVIQVDLLGVDRFARTRSISNVFQGVSVLLAVPIAGMIYDFTKNYDIPYILNGCIRVVSGILMLLILLVRKRQPTGVDKTLVNVELEEKFEKAEQKQSDSEKESSNCQL